MENARERTTVDGTTCGVIAGLIFIVAEMAVADLTSHLPLMPLRMIAGVVAGGSVLEPTTPVGGIAILGLIVHLVFSALFGTAYGALNGSLSARTQARSERQLGLGIVFGALLWVVNFEIIARWVFPWFLSSPPFTQFMLHALFFGAPLGLLYASAERHVPGHQQGA